MMSNATKEPFVPILRLGFMGVTTGDSTIQRLFPLWADALGLDAEIEGHDLPLDAPAEAYRSYLVRLCEDPALRGALVTTHKTRVYDLAEDLFDEIDAHARRCGEISCISKRDGRLRGHAKDPITARLAFEHMLGPRYFAAHQDAEVVCLGAGGAGLAISVMLAEREDRPARLIICDRDQARVRAATQVLDGEPGVEVHGVVDTTDNDRLVAGLPPGSVVINATGLGKDRPGSPLSPDVALPLEGVAWDLNYRGDLQFLEDAAAQASARPLRLFDGWRYFLHGWTEVIAEVFEVEMGPERFDHLAGLASELSPESTLSGR